nr:ANTAR domain-containing protein [Mycolicibacterium komanii]CRL77327.1 ANTAR domain-containing protein [Mycolicibacterium komanii]
MTLTLSSENRATEVTAAAPVTETERLRLEIAQLRDKLAGQPVIEQAKGMLMQTFGLGDEQAFDLLRMLSQVSNVRVRQVADCVVKIWTRCGPRPDFDAAAESLVTMREGLRATAGTAGGK